MIELSKIKRIDGTQARASINQQTIIEYAEHIENGGSFPPIIVFFDGNDYHLADGWHRLLAHERAGCLTIEEDIRLGTARDAQAFSLSANSAHGLPRTNADKRNAVKIALADAEWAQWSDRAIAKLCKVGDHLVADCRKENSACSRTVSKNTQENNELEKRKFTTSTGKTAKHIVKKSEELPPPDDINDEPEYTEVDALRDQVNELRDRLTVGMLDVSEEEKSIASQNIEELRRENKLLLINNKALISARDALAREIVELKKQISYQRKLLDGKK